MAFSCTPCVGRCLPRVRSRVAAELLGGGSAPRRKRDGGVRYSADEVRMTVSDGTNAYIGAAFGAS